MKAENLMEITRVLKLEGDAILQCAQRLEASPEAGAQMDKALDLFKSTLEQGGKIVVTGVGKSGKIAQKIAATLSSTGSLAVFLHPTEGLHGDIGVVTSRDAILAMSHTGNTEEILKLVPSLRTLRVPIVGMGGNDQSVLAQKCDVWLDTSVSQEACPHGLAPTTSTTLALALGDAIAVTLMKLRGFKSTDFAANHPGGSLGKRLTLRVSDLMQRGDAVGTVTKETPIDEVIGCHTKKNLGAVLVVEGSKLLGIITDGDIRRALRHRDRFFDFKAKDVMSTKPVTIDPDQMAQEALTLMENRPNQISCLAVVDAQGNWAGVIRLHDLVRNL
ncbi:KpsF/GutQ family sugar-phosphate isomerase [bacterium]|jgi:arabinose-5-phosphate isomerase|nr:KpsF/GutQ family sugar-phosphate isomerase [bacterium]